MIIDIPVLESTKDSQMQHGLKYENYRRYSSYCSRRLHRLRRSLNVAQGVASSAKARHQRGRKLMDITIPMVMEAGEKDKEFAERMILVSLFLAERSWSYAMQLKQDVLEYPRKRFHMVRRLRKATVYAKRFENLCNDPESPCTDRTKEDAIAYSAYILGLFLVERENWAEAKENLTKSVTIYLRSCLGVKNDEILEHYRQRIDEIRAALRYCAFNLTEMDKSKRVQVELPSFVQFHDLAFLHAQEVEKDIAPPPVVAPKKVSTPEKEVPKQPAIPSHVVKPASMDEDDDEFEETRDVEGESDVDEDEEDEEDDENDKPQGSRIGGVTGLVKGWLGGAWGS